jgi:cysteine desulfurase family protein (TIGR01976 family)
MTQHAYDVESVRAQFPVLNQQGDTPPAVFLDGPAGTQVPQVVLDRMIEALTSSRANLHGNFSTSRRATALIEDARCAVCDLFNARSASEVVFGPNMTTLTISMTRTLAPLFHEGDEIIVTGMEHDGNASPWRMLAAERGLVVKRLDFDPLTYRLQLEELDELITDRTRLIAINYASNLLGTINDVAQICRRARAVGALTYVDAVQYAPHGPIDVQRLDCDFLVASAYKFYGPHIGVLYGRESVLSELRPHKLRIAPDVVPARFETGARSLEGIAGTLGAIEYIEAIGAAYGVADRHVSLERSRTANLHAAFAAMADYEMPLTQRLIEGLRSIDGVTVHGIVDPEDFSERVPTVSVSIDGVHPTAMAEALSDRGIFVWDGHVYAPDVIERLGLTSRGGIVRFGITHYNTAAEIETTLSAVREIVDVNSNAVMTR